MASETIKIPKGSKLEGFDSGPSTLNANAVEFNPNHFGNQGNGQPVNVSANILGGGLGGGNANNHAGIGGNIGGGNNIGVGGTASGSMREQVMKALAEKNALPTPPSGGLASLGAAGIGNPLGGAGALNLAALSGLGGNNPAAIQTLLAAQQSGLTIGNAGGPTGTLNAATLGGATGNSVGGVGAGNLSATTNSGGPGQAGANSTLGGTSEIVKINNVWFKVTRSGGDNKIAHPLSDLEVNQLAVEITRNQLQLGQQPGGGANALGGGAGGQQGGPGNALAGGNNRGGNNQNAQANANGPGGAGNNNAGLLEALGNNQGGLSFQQQQQLQQLIQTNPSAAAQILGANAGNAGQGPLGAAGLQNATVAQLLAKNGAAGGGNNNLQQLLAQGAITGLGGAANAGGIGSNAGGQNSFGGPAASPTGPNASAGAETTGKKGAKKGQKGGKNNNSNWSHGKGIILIFFVSLFQFFFHNVNHYSFVQVIMSFEKCQWY